MAWTQSLLITARQLQGSQNSRGGSCPDGTRCHPRLPASYLVAQPGEHGSQGKTGRRARGYGRVQLQEHPGSAGATCRQGRERDLTCRVAYDHCFCRRYVRVLLPYAFAVACATEFLTLLAVRGPEGAV